MVKYDLKKKKRKNLKCDIWLVVFKMGLSISILPKISMRQFAYR